MIEDKKFIIGKQLKHDDYEQFKNKFYNLALLKGYFDAKFQKSELVVIPSLCQCIWNMDFYSGKRYIIEKIKFRGSQIKEDYLNNIANVYVGSYYDVQSIMTLSRYLSTTNWFKSVLISSDFMYVDSKKLILNILLYPQVKNNFEIGSGYATDIGPRAKVVWKKPWINSYGHSLENSFSLSIKEQIFDLNYKIPVFHNPLEQYYLLQGGIIHEDIHKSFESSVITVNMARYWNYSNDWQYAINVRWNIHHFTRSNIDYKNKMIIYPGINVSRIRQRGEFIPYWGDSQRYSINVSNIFWKSDVNFIILQSQNIWIRTFFGKYRFLIRGNLSWTKTNNWFSVIPAFRFFSVGDRSIRGYKHKSWFFYNAEFLSDSFKLITGSFECQYNIVEKWWSVIFIDIGEIGNNIRLANFESGVGVGVFYRLPIGPIRLDIATPLIKKQKMNYKALCFYINIGPEL